MTAGSSQSAVRDDQGDTTKKALEEGTVQYRVD